MMSSFKNIYEKPLLCLMILWGILIYANNLQGPFIFDDIPNIYENSYLRLTRLTFEGLEKAAFRSPSSNRPIPNITFALNYYFHRYDKPGYHIINILIHIITGILLYLLVKSTLDISGDFVSYQEAVFPISFFTACIWLVHPIQTQTVSYIVQRMNSMAAMFYLLSFLSYVKARLSTSELHKRLLIAGSVLAGIFALGSKEIAVTLPFFIFLYEWYFFQKLSREWLLRIFRNYFVYISGLVLFLLLMIIMYIGVNPVEKILAPYAHRDFTLPQRVLTEFRVVIHYITLLLYPHPSQLSLTYDFPLSYSLINPISTLISAGIITGIIAAAAYMAKKERLISFCIFWFFGQLLLESSVIGLEIIFEHRTYLPSMFFILIGVMLFWKSRSVGISLKITVLCSVIVLMSVWTHERNSIWGNDMAFWRDCVKKSPKNSRAHNNLGLALARRGRTKEAAEQYSEAIRLNPEYLEAHNNLGNRLATQGQIEKAIAHYSEAVRINPRHMDAHYNLGLIFDRQGERLKALRHYADALRLRSGDAEIHNNMGVILYKLGQTDRAIAHLQTASQLNPDDTKARDNLATVLAQKEKINKEISEIRENLKLNPEDMSLHYELGNLYKKAGKPDEAIIHYQKALSIQPDFVEALNQLAIVFAIQGKYDKAVPLLDKIIQIQPDNAQACYDLASIYAIQNQAEASVFWLEEAVRKGYDNREFMKIDNNLRNIRGTSVYQRLVNTP